MKYKNKMNLNKMTGLRSMLLTSGASLIVLLCFLGSTSMRGAGGHDHKENDEHGDEEEEKKGPHGGRLLEKGDFQLEVTIFESGVPPQYRVYAYDDGKALDPGKVSAQIELKRIGGRIDQFTLKPTADYLTADQTVEEPHSFDVKVDAEWDGKKYSWSYPSYEGRTELTPEAMQKSGIVVENAGPAKLKVKLAVNGRLVPDEDHLAHVSPRFPGIVKEARKRLGDKVNQGDLLAIVESNSNLNRYEIRSVLAGTVVKKDITVGEFVSEKDTIYVVADLANVWVDLNIYRQDFPKIKVGQELTLHMAGNNTAVNSAEVKTKLSYISPFGSESTQSMLARAILPNTTGDMLPGLFVVGDLTLEEVDAPVAVRATAIQKFRDWDVVFVQEGNVLEALPIQLGRSDGEWVEVLSGIKAGQSYVAKNSFVVKADIMKSGASHDH